MHYPLVLSSHRRIVIAPEGWFNGIGRLDAARGELDIGINHLGEGGLAWFLDAQGLFHALQWQGRQPRSLGQWVGLSRQRERYAIASPRQVTAGEMLQLTEGYTEQAKDTPNTADLRSDLQALPGDRVIDQAFMRGYLGV